MDRIVNLETALTVISTSTVCPVNVSEREAQIKALVDKKINALIKEHEEEISGRASVYTKNYLGKEYTVEEYKNMISDLEEKLYRVPSEYSTVNMREEYQNNVKREIEYIKSDMQKMLNFKDYLRQVEENIYEKYPLDIYQVIANVKRYIKNRISYYQKDITMEYYDHFMDKIMNLCPKDGKDYSKRISTVFKNRMSIKSMDTIYNFFEMLEYKLTVAVSMFNDYNMNEYDKLQGLLKSVIENLIMYFHGVITDFLIERIECIDDEEMTDSQAVQTYAEYCIREMNLALRQELPDVLDNAMITKFENIMEDLKVRSKNMLGFNISKVEAKPPIIYSEESPDVEVVITKPQVENYVVSSKPKRDFTEFLKTIGDEPIIADDLVRLYNNYFGVSVNILSLSKSAGIKENFNVKRVMRSGKKVRVYVKI